MQTITVQVDDGTYDVLSRFGGQGRSPAAETNVQRAVERAIAGAVANVRSTELLVQLRQLEAQGPAPAITAAVEAKPAVEVTPAEPPIAEPAETPAP